MNFQQILDIEVGPDQGLICEMNTTGDNRQTWDRNNPESVAIARDTFNSARGRGMAAYRVKKDGSKGEVMREFDPSAELIILAPPMQGGTNVGLR